MAKGGKRRCEMGKACPYLKEHQHQLEFSHDGGDGGGDGDGSGKKKTPPPFVGGGRSLGYGAAGGRSGRGRNVSSSSSSSSTAARGLLPSRDARAAAALARAPASSSVAAASSAGRASSSRESDRKGTSKKRPAASSSSGWISRKRPAAASSRPSSSASAARSSRRRGSDDDDDIVVLDDKDDGRAGKKSETPRVGGSRRPNALKAGSPIDLNTPEGGAKKKRNASSRPSIDLCDSESDSDDVVVCDGSAPVSGAATGSRQGIDARRQRIGRQMRPFHPVATDAGDFAAAARPATRPRSNQPDALRHLLAGGGMVTDPMSPFGGGAAAAAAASMGILPADFGSDPARAQGQLQAQQAQRLEAAARARAQAEEKRQLSHAIAASNREVTNQQDQEFHESLAEDQRKEREREEEEQMKRIEEEGKMMEEERDAREKKEDSERQRAEALGGLEDEPEENDPDAATVAFRMPAKCKERRVVRRFRRTGGVGQLARYLRGECAEKLGEVKSWTLREVMGGGKIGEGDKGNGKDGAEKTIEDLGLFPRGLVIVRDEGC